MYNALSAHKQQRQKGRHTENADTIQMQVHSRSGNTISICIKVWSPRTIVDFIDFASEKKFNLCRDQFSNTTYLETADMSETTAL